MWNVFQTTKQTVFSKKKNHRSANEGKRFDLNRLRAKSTIRSKTENDVSGQLGSNYAKLMLIYLLMVSMETSIPFSCRRAKTSWHSSEATISSSF